MYKHIYADHERARSIVDQIEKHMEDGWQLVHTNGSWLQVSLGRGLYATLHKESPEVTQWPQSVWQRVYDNYWSRHPEELPDFIYP